MRRKKLPGKSKGVYNIIYHTGKKFCCYPGKQLILFVRHSQTASELCTNQ